MIAFLDRGFKCYVAGADSGASWGFVALKASHPYHGKTTRELPVNGLDWTSTAENYARVQTSDKPSGSIGSKGDWLLGFKCDDEVFVRDEIDMIVTLASGAAKRVPPEFMTEDFRDAVMPEIISRNDSPENRREAWIAFVEMCVDNNVITDEQATVMHEPRGLTKWPASEFY